MFNCNEVTNQRQNTCRGIEICYSSGCNCAAGWKGSNCDKGTLIFLNDMFLNYSVIYFVSLVINSRGNFIQVSISHISDF